MKGADEQEQKWVGPQVEKQSVQGGGAVETAKEVSASYIRGDLGRCRGWWSGVLFRQVSGEACLLRSLCAEASTERGADLDLWVRKGKGPRQAPRYVPDAQGDAWVPAGWALAGREG